MFTIQYVDYSLGKKNAISSGDGVDYPAVKQNGINLPSGANSAITQKGGF